MNEDLESQQKRLSRHSVALSDDTTTGAQTPRPQYTRSIAWNQTDRTQLPPDGGLEAWTQVLTGHLVLFNSFGLIQTFGIFQPYYENHLNRPPFNVSWIGSIHIFLVYFIATFSGHALDAGWYKSSLAVGATLQLMGLFLAAQSKVYWMLFLFHGVFQGVAHGMIFCPAVTNTATYFHKRRTTAMALVACGGGIGGLVFAAIASCLLENFGIAWTLRVIGFVVLFNSILIISLARTRKKATSRQSRPVVEWRAFKDKSYTLYVLAMFFVFAGVWVPYFYIRSFVTEIIHANRQTSFILILLLNGAGLPGRILPALLSDRYLGALNAYILITLLTSLTLFLWPLVTSIPAMYPWAMAYGFCAGGVASLLQAGIASLNEGDEGLGVKIGMGFSVVSVASLMGSPVGGVLIERGMGWMGFGGEFLWLQVFTGGMLGVGCSILAGTRVSRTGWRVWK
ncbi:MFS general substrate transporter [Zopfia rhizophila CBS 207.26]|uniref:MFS general substrate transporter n=1 Tax=Zopfia rhizophila CBS 207.26 TaxID=1314779 RepID=A0A6A6DR10_9PEZI|nr:MFS general substrate transporter [Zopfia rhizophila CBS 207.26]